MTKDKDSLSNFIKIENSMIENLKQSESQPLYSDIPQDKEQVVSILNLLNKDEFPELNQTEQKYLENINFDYYRENGENPISAVSAASGMLRSTHLTCNLSVSNIDSFLYSRKFSVNCSNLKACDQYPKITKSTSNALSRNSSFAWEDLTCPLSFLKKRSRRGRRHAEHRKKHRRGVNFKRRPRNPRRKPKYCQILIQMRNRVLIRSKIAKNQRFLDYVRQIFKATKGIQNLFQNSSDVQFRINGKTYFWKIGKEACTERKASEGPTSWPVESREIKDVENIGRLTYLQTSEKEFDRFRLIYFNLCLNNPKLKNKGGLFKMIYFFLLHSSRSKKYFYQLSFQHKKMFLIFLYFKIFKPKKEIKSSIQNYLEIVKLEKEEKQSHLNKVQNGVFFERQQKQKILLSKIEFAVLNLLFNQSKSMIKFLGGEKTTQSIQIPNLEFVLSKICFDDLQLLYFISQLHLNVQMIKCPIQLCFNRNAITFDAKIIKHLKRQFRLNKTKNENLLKFSFRYFLKELKKETIFSQLYNTKINKSNVSKFKSEVSKFKSFRKSKFEKYLLFNIDRNILNKISIFIERFSSENEMLKYLINSKSKGPISIQQMLNSLQILDECK